MTILSLATLDLASDAFLRPLVPDDATQAYVDGLNDEVVHEFLAGLRAMRQTMDSVRQFVALNVADPRGILFGLFVGGTLRGTSRLHAIGEPAGAATIGIALFDRTIWGQGRGPRVIESICLTAQDHFQVNEIHAGIEEGNRRSQKAFRRSGFVPQDGNPVEIGRKVVRYWIRHMSAQMVTPSRKGRA